MTSDKISVSMSSDLSKSIRAAARRSGVSTSSWLADAAAARLRAEAFDGFIEDWQREHGTFTEDELAAGAARLGLDESVGSRHRATRKRRAS